MVESKIKVIEIESSKASAQEDLKRPDPDERTAAEIIARNTVTPVAPKKESGAAHEITKKSD